MSDRLISADKARQVLTHLLYETALNNDDYIMDIYEDIIENRLDTWIELIPTVDAEPVRHGRWQVNEVNGHKDMTCLSCGWLFEYHDGLEEEWNYCPHCGALQSFAIATERREDATND